MAPSKQASIYVFGDNHKDEYEEVEKRLNSVISEDTEVLVMEHSEKVENQDPSQWVLLKNPSMLLLQLLLVRWQKKQRASSNRITEGSQTSVAETVAEGLGLEIRYTDLSSLQRFNRQPLYLTVSSWIAFLALIFGWILNPFFSIISIALVPATGFWSQRVYMSMRNEKMAEDLRQFGIEYSEIVFFAGDSHLDPIKKLLGADFEIVEKEGARP